MSSRPADRDRPRGHLGHLLAKAGDESVPDPSQVRVVEAAGSTGRLRFVLQRFAGGLYVEREEIPERGTRTCISMEFGSRAEFIRWYEGDASRFEHPLLHERVRRDADDLWAADG